MATSKDGTDITGEYEITVRFLVSSITITGSKVMYAEKQQTLTCELLPKFTTLTEVVWSSSDETLATVDAEGVVSSLKPGTVIISCTSVDSGKCTGTFEITINETPVNASQTLVDPQVATMEEGAKILYNGIEFIVGKTAFSNMKDAIEISSGVVYVAAGDYTDAIKIEKSNISLLGPNYNIDPITKMRNNEAKINASINISENLTNIAIKGFTFTEAASVILANGNDNIELSYNVLDNSSCDGIIDGFNGSNLVSNIKVTYNYSNNYKGNRFVRMYNVRNIELSNNSITCTASYDFLNVQGYICGDVVIKDNLYIKSAQSFIYAKGVKDINCVIEGNYMKDVDNTGIDFRNMNNDGDVKADAKFVIRFNTFDNCGCGWCPVRIRTAGYTSQNTIAIDLSYNKFIDSYYEGDPIQFLENPSYDAQSDPFKKIYVIGRNYYEKGGVAVTTLVDGNFCDAAISIAEPFATAADCDAAAKLADITMYVDASWAEKVAGDEVEAEGKKWIYGTNAFSKLSEVLAVAKEGDGIKFAPGIYDEAVTISINNLKLFGHNEGVNPNATNRTNESVLSNVISLAAGVKNVTISGFSFTELGQILGSTAGGIDNFNCLYNVFDANNQMKDSASGELAFLVTDATACNKDMVIKCCRFESTGNRTVNLHATNLNGLYLYGCFFEGTYGTYNDCLKLNDTSAYAVSGKVVIEANEFLNVSQYTIWILKYIDLDLQIIGNTFTHCGFGGGGDGYLRAPITLATYEVGSKKSTVLIEKNTFSECDLGVRIQLATHTEENFEATVRNNKFLSWAEPVVITNYGKGTVSLINAEYNYFGQEVSNSSFSGVSSYAKAYTNIDDVPEYVRADVIDITEVHVTNKVDSLPAYSDYQIEYTTAPENATNKKVLFTSSNTDVATVDAAGLISAKGKGTTTITVKGALDATIVDSFEFTITEVDRVEVSYDGNGVLYIGDAVQLNAKFAGSGTAETLSYESNSNEIATVSDSGLVTAVAAGTVLIKVKSGSIESTVGFTVIDKNAPMSDLMKYLVEHNSGCVFYQRLNYIGYEVGFESVPHDVYGAVNDYMASAMPEITRNMLPAGRENNPETPMKSIEFIVVHDTGAASASSTAKANSGWCNNETNTGSSWHYTVGNDGIYQQIEDNMVAWHAGDGTGWGETTTWTDSGIVYAGDRPKVTIGTDGYFYINGQKSNVESPRNADGTVETRTNDLGIVCVKGSNGNYMIPTTWVTSGYNNVVAARGGNLNGIGIESAVNTGSDVYLTWEYLAKLCASLCVKHDLLPDRVTFHNNWSNKTCPNTMMTNGVVDEFLDLVYAEYEIAKNYSDYTITFTSNNPEIIDNSGRIVKVPNQTTNVSYTITVEKDGVKESITLNCLVYGRYNY